jgi:hypothetical protein
MHQSRRTSNHLAPVLFDGVISSTKVITWDSWRNMVWDMHIYVMAKDLYPVKVHYSYEIQLKRQHVPMIISLEIYLLVQNYKIGTLSQHESFIPKKSKQHSIFLLKLQ